MKNKAFTLIELLVVIAIIGLLASIVLVSLKGQRDKARIARGLQFSQSLHHALGAYAVGVWRFDEGSGTTAIDASGYGNHGTLGDGTCVPGSGSCPSWTNDTPSGQGYALSFDGVDDYVVMPGSTSLDTPDALTVSAWIYDLDGGAINHSINKDWDTRIWIIRADSSTTVNWHIWNSDGTLKQFVPANSWAVDQWFHIVGTAKVVGTEIEMEIFFNGVSKGTTSFPGTAIQVDTNTPVAIATSKATTHFKKQLIDDVRIYEKSLTLSQIESLYYVGLDNLLAKGLISEQEYQERLVLR